MWLGPALTKLLVTMHLRGVYSPEGGCPRVVVAKIRLSCPYFENCIVDASIFVAILLFLMYV